jgi:hypothetical protein
VTPKIEGCALEARGGIEPPIKVLQTFALPLGDRAFEASAKATHHSIAPVRFSSGRLRA